MRQYRGFSLVELLVVIAIISVLAAILLPTMQRALSVSQAMDCLNRKKQIMTATQYYVDQYNGWTDIARDKMVYRLICGRYLPTNQLGLVGQNNWREPINTPIVYCSLTPRSKLINTGWASAWRVGFRGYYYTYFNLAKGKIIARAGAFTSDFVENGTVAATTTTESKPFSQFALYADVAYWNILYPTSTAFRIYHCYGAVGPCAFADGHAELLAPEQLARFGITGYVATSYIDPSVN